MKKIVTLFVLLVALLAPMTLIARTNLAKNVMAPRTTVRKSPAPQSMATNPPPWLSNPVTM